MQTVSALRAFHGDAAIKSKFIARVRLHREADQLVKGLCWEDGKGCAIGCTLDAYDHSRYPDELGLPEWLARLEDAIFEGLPNTEAMAWPESFLEAITPGVDVEPVRHKLAMRRIDRLIALQTSALAAKHAYGVHEAIEQTIAVLHQVRRCHEAEAQGDSCDWTPARSAESAAWSAESAAWSAWSAARSAWSAARSAWSAARSAESAAWSAESAESAAESAVWSAAWIQEASDLLELLREAA